MDSEEEWAGPLACLSLPSAMSSIRSDSPIWKLDLPQSPRIKRSRKRVKYIISPITDTQFKVDPLLDPTLV